MSASELLKFGPKIGHARCCGKPVGCTRIDAYCDHRFDGWKKRCVPKWADRVAPRGPGGEAATND